MTDRVLSTAAPVRHTQDRITPLPFPVAVLVGAGSGACILLAFPPYGFWLLLPVGIGGLTAAVLTRSWLSAAIASLAGGLAFFVPLTAWANIYAGLAPWLVLGVFESLYLVLFGLCARTVLVRRGLNVATALVVSGLWVGAETVRSTLPWGGLSWGASAFALADSPLLNLGPWVGMAGLAFTCALIGQFLLGGVFALLGRRHGGINGLAGVWPLALVAAVLLGSMVIPSPRNPAPADGSSLRIAGIQGNTTPVDPGTMIMPTDLYGNQVSTTEEVIAQQEEAGQDLDLVVWPEDTTADPRADATTAWTLEDLSARADAPLLVGTQTPTDDGMRLNNSIAWSADGGTGYVYAKQHPVPFGEYVPYRDFFRTFSDKVDLVGTDMKAGTEVGVMDVQGHGVGTLICFEIAYDDLVVDAVRGGSQVIVVQSNNALFGDSDEAIQQLAEARVMGVISGRSVVHVSTVGHSGIYSPDGRQLDFQEHWTQGAVVADVPLRTGITPAVAAGDWIAVGLSALGLAGLAVALSRRSRAIARTAPRTSRSDRSSRSSRSS
jgi:apolipoprotein N-acyltransferase